MGVATVDGTSDNGRGSFISRSSLLTFAGASVATVVIYNLLRIFLNVADPKVRVIVALVSAAPVGVILYFASLKTNMDQGQRIEAAFIAFLNTVVLAFAATGFDATAVGTPQLPPTGPTPSPTPLG